MPLFVCVCVCLCLYILYRYIAESMDNPIKSKEAEDARRAYKEAEAASTGLKPTDALHLGLILNISVFMYEILGERVEAVKLSRKTFDGALNDLDTLDEAAYNESAAIMQLLKDNISLWTQELQEEKKAE